MGAPSRGIPVVVKFVDGRVLKGTTQDFAPRKSTFHLAWSDNPNAPAMSIALTTLKALFFVRTYGGIPNYGEDSDIARAKGHGRQILVTLADGEVVSGFTTGDGREKPGFFVVPIDPRSSHTRIFVMTAAVKTVVWADAPAPEPVST